jgi:anti-anti-sigma regulatory factor
MRAIVESFGEVNEELLQVSERMVAQLSSPILPIYKGIIVMPLIGAIDAERSRAILEALLAGVVRHRATLAIIDVTGTAAVDSVAAEHLVRAVRAVGLLGAEVIIAGISAGVARTLVHEGLTLATLTMAQNLQGALEQAFGRQGYRIVKQRR